ncbi:hypothetical protein [Micromonospora cathayae]|uniref:Uncharacterized protein n=1 Tax=Micromonospora cathayae TaxID=3028804 RepID=A0ABY7ZWE5_9ACTN|nr:hypothetical protein [Micromonospora sp. HUAS 3]WDZ87208.1 hypothetical protein PVK37_12770 [Micromonospora sp. HUAS 3]
MTPPTAPAALTITETLIAAANDPAVPDIWRDPDGDIVGVPMSLARVAVAALAEAGRLYPADSTTAEQWAVRVSSVPDGDGVGLPHATRAEAEATIRLRQEHRPRYPITYELVRRELRRWPDGSVLVSAWTPAEVKP